MSRISQPYLRHTSDLSLVNISQITNKSQTYKGAIFQEEVLFTFFLFKFRGIKDAFSKENQRTFSTRAALRCPDWLLTDLVIPLEAFRGPKLPQLVSKGVSGPLSGQSGHLKATLVLWGALQVSMNMYLSIPESRFVLQISQPPKITQNWFCI